MAGTVVIATFQRGKGGTSPFPVSIPADRKDAHINVNNLTERDAIEEWRRISRMTCFVVDQNETYRLGTDITIPGQVWTSEGTGGDFQLISEKGQINGYAPINAEGYIDPIFIRSLYVQDAFVVADEAARFALTAKTGDICHQLDNETVYVKLNNNAPPTVAGDWADITAASAVTSVNGEVGAVSITINNLLLWGNNQNEFNTAVGNSSAVLNNASQIINNSTNINAIYVLIADLQNDPAVDIPLYSASVQYEIGNTVLYDPGIGRLNLYRCKVAPVGVGVAPDNDFYWDRTGDFYTQQEIDDMMALKADLVGGKVPLAQLPVEQLTTTYVVADIAERDALIAVDDIRVIVLNATGETRLPNGGVTEYLYKPSDPKADSEGFVWMGEDTDQAYDFNRTVKRMPEIGKTEEGNTITEGLESMFFGPTQPDIKADVVSPREVGISAQFPFTGTVTREEADTIDQIDYVRVSDETILQSDTPASPALDSQNLSFDAPAVTMLIGSTETYRVDVTYTKDSVQKVIKGNELIFEGVYPILYGNADEALADVYTLTKLTEREGNQYVGVSGNLRNYYCIPDIYVELVDIVDQHKDSQFNSFFPNTPTVISVSSNGLAADWTTNYKVYKSNYDSINDGERYGYLSEYEDESTSESAIPLNNAKLDSIQFGAQVNQTDSQIKFQYESNLDTNAFTDAEKSKLTDIEALAEVNQDDATIKTQYENNAETNAYTDLEKSKLAGINTAAIGDMHKSEFVIDLPLPSIVNRAQELVAAGFNQTALTIPHGRYLKVTDVNLAGGYGLVRPADNTLNDGVDAMAEEDILPGEVGRIGVVIYNPTIDTTGRNVGDPVYLGQNGTTTFTAPTTGSLIQVGVVYHVGNPGFIASFHFDNLLTVSFQANWRPNTFYPKGTMVGAYHPTEPALGLFILRAKEDFTSPPVFDPGRVDFFDDWEIAGGDMKTGLYDPNDVDGDAFDMSNMIDNANHVRMTKAQQTKLDGLEEPTFKGYFNTPNVLNAEYPVGEVGWSAIVVFENDESTPNGNLWQWIGTPTDAWVDSGQAGLGGDMNTSTYDPRNILADVFDMDQMTEGADTDKLFYSLTERNKLSGLEEGSNYYNKTELDAAHALKADVTYVDVQDALKMDKTVYDPGSVNGDAFNMDNMVEGATTKILSDTERADIAQNKTDRHTHANKTLLDTIIDSGDGEAYLANDGTYQDAAKAGIHNGTCIEQQDIFIVESGGLVYADVEKVGGGDLQVYFGNNSYFLDCTTGAGAGGRARVQLVAGTAIAPQINNIYVYLNTGVPELASQISIDLFPSEFAWVGITALRDAVNVGLEGPIVLQRFTDAATHNDRGRLSYLGERLRVVGSKWWSGVDQTVTLTPQALALDDLHISVLTGIVYQLHRQVFPAINIATDGIYITGVDGNGTLQNYDNVVNLNAVDEYSDGSAIQDGDYYNLVVFGVINKEQGQCKLFVNPSAAGYSTANAAYNDKDNLANMSVPIELRTVAFLVARIPLRYTTADNGTLAFINPAGKPEFIDLRGEVLDVRNESGTGESSTNTAEDVTYDNVTSGLTADNVQDALDELSVQIGGGLYYDSGGTPALIIAGEVNPTTSLFASIENMDSPAAGRLRSTIAGNVVVTASMSAEMVTNNTQARFQIAVNGTPVAGAFATAQNGPSTAMSNPAITLPLTLAANDYVSVFMTGSSVDLYDFTMSIKGEQ